MRFQNEQPLVDAVDGVSAIAAGAVERARTATTNQEKAWNFAAVGALRDICYGSVVGDEGVQELVQVADLLAAQGYYSDRIIIDPSVVRGLGYYTGPVFEAELTFEILDEKGRPRQFGSVAGGGRYDDLVKRFTGQPVPATGVSIGVDRLLAALDAKGKGPGKAQGPVVVTVMDRARMADYMALVNELRQAGIRAEMYLGNPKNFGNQLKYADKRESPVAIIMGEDEAARGVVQVKDLIPGAQITPAEGFGSEMESAVQSGRRWYARAAAKREVATEVREVTPLRYARARARAYIALYENLLAQNLWNAFPVAARGESRERADILQPARERCST